MSTGHMPNPPEQPTKQASTEAAQTQANAPMEAQSTEITEPLPLGADMARIIEEQVDIITQRQVYHSQIMLGVSATGTDSVNARNVALTVANALRNDTSDALVNALVNLGDPQLAQVNDHTLPYNYNAQVVGLLEGILIDTVSQAYTGDPDRLREARMKLEKLFIEANEQAEKQPKALLAFLAPKAETKALQ
jgi:hypothetical protein